jgi:hypothetical protein
MLKQNNAVPLHNSVAATCTVIPPVTTDQILVSTLQAAQMKVHAIQWFI